MLSRLPPAASPPSTTALPLGQGGPSGGFEGSPGNITPPRSPPLAAQDTASSATKHTSPMRITMGQRSSSSSNNNMLITASSASSGTGGAMINITIECERLFCETLRAVFLGERNGQLQDSLVMGSYNSIDSAISGRSRRRMSSMDSGPLLGTILAAGLGTPPPDKHVSRPAVSVLPQIVQWLEIYDYTSDARFRGFIATNSIGQRSLFIFFEHNIVGKDLKQALMALIELSSTPALPPCDQMVVCFDREEEETPVTKALLRDLGWIGFELSTLKDWAEGLELTSSKWLFVAMDV